MVVRGHTVYPSNHVQVAHVEGSRILQLCHGVLPLRLLIIPIVVSAAALVL